MWRNIERGAWLAAILAVVIALYQVSRANAISARQNYLLEQQVSLAGTVATVQAGDANTPATATAKALRIDELEATRIALVTLQAQASGYSPTQASEWNELSSAVPESGTTLARDLAKGEFLYLSGGSFSVGDVFCGNDSEQICVLIFEATYAQRVTIDHLVARNNYLGRTSLYGYDELIRIHEPFFWKWPNCQSQQGCAKATIYYLFDGSSTGFPTVILRP